MAMNLYQQKHLNRHVSTWHCSVQ